MRWVDAKKDTAEQALNIPISERDIISAFQGCTQKRWVVQFNGVFLVGLWSGGGLCRDQVDPLPTTAAYRVHTPLMCVVLPKNILHQNPDNQ